MVKTSAANSGESSFSEMAALYIIEGVAGSGKDTLCAQIVEALQPQERRVLVFSEEAVLATWLYYFVPGIHELRLDLAERLIDHSQTVLSRDPDAAFVFNRLHVSFAVWRQERNADPSLEERHRKLVTALSTLPVQIFQAVLTKDEALGRTSHVERRELAWRQFLEERVRSLGDADAGSSYLRQQEAMTRVLEADGLPYGQVHVGIGWSLPKDFLSRQNLKTTG